TRAGAATGAHRLRARLLVSTASAQRPCAANPGGDQRAATASAPPVSSPSEKDDAPSGSACGRSAAVKSAGGSATRVHSADVVVPPPPPRPPPPWSAATAVQHGVKGLVPVGEVTFGSCPESVCFTVNWILWGFCE